MTKTVTILKDVAGIAQALDRRLRRILEDAELDHRDAPLAESSDGLVYEATTLLLPVTELTEGIMLWARPSRDNEDGFVTLKVDETPAKPVKLADGSDVTPGVLHENAAQLFVFSTVEDAWIVSLSFEYLVQRIRVALDPREDMPSWAIELDDEDDTVSQLRRLDDGSLKDMIFKGFWEHFQIEEIGPGPDAPLSWRLNHDGTFDIRTADYESDTAGVRLSDEGFEDNRPTAEQDRGAVRAQEAHSSGTFDTDGATVLTLTPDIPDGETRPVLVWAAGTAIAEDPDPEDENAYAEVGISIQLDGSTVRSRVMSDTRQGQTRTVFCEPVLMQVDGSKPISIRLDSFKTGDGGFETAGRSELQAPTLMIQTLASEQ